MRITSIVGARPQFVKLAPVARALAGLCDHRIIHTGQHYDIAMSDVFFAELDIPRPDHHCGVGSESHGAQTGRMLESIERLLVDDRPDAVIVYGDTNSTLAAALAATKLHVPVVHLEAGLRSFDRSMPEEVNRVMTDHTADLCLAPTLGAMANLATEGLGARSLLVGDVMTDILFDVRDGLDAATAPPPPFDGAPFTLATLHRPANTDSPERLREVIQGLAGQDRPTLLLAHPRLVAKAAEAGVQLDVGNIAVRGPVGYRDLVRLVLSSSGVVTDSGGLQKEAFLLRRPCVTVRSDTEWTETVELGWNALVGERPSDIATALSSLPTPGTDETPYGDGRAAQRTAEAVLEFVA